MEKTNRAGRRVLGGSVTKMGSTISTCNSGDLEFGPLVLFILPFLLSPSLTPKIYDARLFMKNDVV
jgi:hypothetical protein